MSIETTTTAAPSPPRSASDDVVDEWFIETFHNIGLDTPLFNRFSAAREMLKARLRAKEK